VHAVYAYLRAVDVDCQLSFLGTHAAFCVGELERPGKSGKGHRTKQAAETYIVSYICVVRALACSNSHRSTEMPKGPRYTFADPEHAKLSKLMQRHVWFGVLQLDKKRTETLVKRWHTGPDGNSSCCASVYYKMFPELWPKHYPVDHYLKMYKAEQFTNTLCDYRTWRPKPSKAYFNTKCADCCNQRSFILSDDGEPSYGICDRCEVVYDAMSSAWHDGLKEWLVGKPMPVLAAKDFVSTALNHKCQSLPTTTLSDAQWASTF